MTLTQKFYAKKSKSGFTLVELVIVIAILAILAAIAVPVITTTINSAKISTLKSDASTVNFILSEALTASLAGYGSTYQYKVGVTAGFTNLEDLSVAEYMNVNDLDEGLLSERVIGGDYYAIGWTGSTVAVYCSEGSIDATATGYNFADMHIGELMSGGAPSEAVPSDTGCSWIS